MPQFNDFSWFNSTLIILLLLLLTYFKFFFITLHLAFLNLFKIKKFMFMVVV